MKLNHDFESNDRLVPVMRLCGDKLAGLGARRPLNRFSKRVAKIKKSWFLPETGPDHSNGGAAMEHTIKIWDLPQLVHVNRTAKSTWNASGDYLGKRIDVKGYTEAAALKHWREAALIRLD